MNYKEALQDPIFKIISQSAKELHVDSYVIGGFVRDFILNRGTAKDIDVVCGMYDEMGLGALAAVKSRGLSGKITIMGYDNTPDAYAAIKRGEMHATVDTAPKEMGYNLIYAVKKIRD